MRSASRTPRDWGDENWRWQAAGWNGWQAQQAQSSSSSGWKDWKEDRWADRRWKWDDFARKTWDDGYHWGRKEEQAASASAAASPLEDLPEPWYVDAHDLTLHPRGPHSFTMILLHSCSGGPDDWTPILHRLKVPFRNEIRFVVPCAPVRRESHHSWKGEQNSWFEYAEDGDSAKDPQELTDQIERIQQLMEEEIARLPGEDPKRLLLAGFSQGVALAVEAAVSFSSKTSPLLLLRGAALSAGARISAKEEELGAMKVLAHHGRWDRMCPPETALESYQRRLAGAQLHWVVDENLGHACARGRQQLCAGEFQQINDFVLEIWGPLSDSSSDSA